MPISTIVNDDIATVQLNRGKVNALDQGLIRELRAAIEATSGSRALIITGVPGVFTGGLDTRALAAVQAEDRVAFFIEFGQLILDLWVAPMPVVCAATGHAIAAGTLLALASDHVVAAQGNYRWGMTEGRIGLDLSNYAIMLVRSRVGAQYADKLLLEGRVLDPEEAVRVGLADEAVAEDRVLARASEVAGELALLPRGVYARNKHRLRLGLARVAMDELPADINRLVSSAADADLDAHG